MTEDDLQLLKYLFECNFLTRDQIKKHIWKNKSKSYSTKRLWQLTKEKIIKKRPDPLSLNNRKSILMATEKGLDLLELHRDTLKNSEKLKNQTGNYYRPKKYYSARDQLDLRQYEHDKDMTSIRLYFEEKGAKKWTPHGVILRDKMFKRYPDGIFENRNNVFAVELEYNQKSKSILKDVFERYNHEIVNKKINYVLYIAKTKSIAEAMLRYFNPEMIENFIDIVDGEDEQGNRIKKEKIWRIYQRFFVTTIDDITKGNLEFEGVENYIDLEEVFK